jgi:hypothetical protein
MAPQARVTAWKSPGAMVMPKVLIKAFRDDGMNQFEARPDVTYEIIEGTLEELGRKSPTA